MKDKVFPYIPEAFGFVAATPGDTLKVEQNKLQHDWLVSNRNFMYAKSSYKVRAYSFKFFRAWLTEMIWAMADLIRLKNGLTHCNTHLSGG